MTIDELRGLVKKIKAAEFGGSAPASLGRVLDVYLTLAQREGADIAGIAESVDRCVRNCRELMRAGRKDIYQE